MGRATRSQYSKTGSLRSLIIAAYDLPHWLIIAPDWLEDVKFEINAKLPEGATQAQIPAMLQKLLAERLGVVTHREPRPIRVFELRNNGAKVHEDAATIDPGPDTTQGKRISVRDLSLDGGGWPIISPDAKGSYFAKSGSYVREGFRSQTMASFIENFLTRGMGAPVIDKTGLKGKYSFDLTFIDGGPVPGIVPPPEVQARLAAREPGTSMVDAVERLGFRLVETKAPVEVLVVDKANREPIEN
jgi:uncharacterized protein (TIGR03435 family)